MYNLHLFLLSSSLQVIYVTSVGGDSGSATTPLHADISNQSSNVLPLTLINTSDDPEDFAFALWRKPTYHFFNNKLMRQDLVPLWNHISQLIRKDAINKNREYFIETGAYRIPKPNDSNIHIPEIWLKKVFLRYNEPHDEMPKYKSISIIMSQCFDESPEFDPADQICEKNLCEDFFITRFPKVGKSIRCCSVVNNEVIEGYLKIHQDLEIDFLRGRDA